MFNNKKTIKRNMKKFLYELFRDDNALNEKSIAGFIALLMMVIALIVDLVTGYMGKELALNQFIFDGFLYIVLGAFGIASIDKMLTHRNKKSDIPTEETPNEEEQN